MGRPAAIETEAQLDELLSEPAPEVVETLGRLHGDIILLGAAGKMGPTLARMARRASDAAGISRRIIAVSRFSSGDIQQFQAHGIETIRCDLLDEDAVARLPEAANVVFMTGRKFGSTGDEATTWAMNALVPAFVSRKYRTSRIVAFSTGNVYALTPIASGGSREGDVLDPVGEYGMSCVGRERMFGYFSQALAIPMAIVRLNYACELRYGVLADLARKVWAGAEIDLGMGHFNAIWQGDANALTLRAFDQVASPPWVVNVAGPETLSVRSVCEQFGQLMKKHVRFRGIESATALLSNSSRACEQLGKPRVSINQMIEWIAQWVMQGGRSLNKPTHFESRDGRF